jgi:hypothetical protein
MGPPRLPTSLDEVERALQDANVAPLATEVGMSVAAGYASGLALRFVGRCERNPPGPLPPFNPNPSNPSERLHCHAVGGCHWTTSRCRRTLLHLYHGPHAHALHLKPLVP